MRTRDGWRAEARIVADIAAARLPGLVGVYAHGSAAQGTITNGSDLDLLIVTTDESMPAALPTAILAASTPYPLEVSVVRASDAQEPCTPWPFLLHVNGQEKRFVMGDGHGDSDLIAHYAMTRASGVAVCGPPPDQVIGTVPRDTLLAYLVDELQWATTHADQRYLVLNACRAARFAATGDLVSKVAGALWWLQVRGADATVMESLAAQREGRSLGPSSSEALDFAELCIAELV